MPTYNNVNYLSLPKQVEKNRTDIETINEDIDGLGVGPQGATGPQGSQGVQGNVGPAGPDGTPVEGLVVTSTLDATLGYYIINLNDMATSNAKKFTLLSDSFFSNKLYFSLWINDILQTEKVSAIDEIILRDASSVLVFMYYDQNGQIVTHEANANTDILKIGFNVAASSFTANEVLGGSTTGPTGPAGAQGDPGVAGAAGAQGIQGLPGEQNMRYLDTYEDGDTFPEYAYRVMVQCIGGNYDGMIFIKEALENDDTVKFGPYATLVQIETPVATIISTLLNGVTSIRVYAIENLT